MRYVDDMMGTEEVTALLPTKEQYGLEYSTKEVSEAVVFVGRKIRSTNDGLVSEIADKQDVISMVIQRYPHAESAVPAACRKGCVIGALHYAMDLGETEEAQRENLKMVVPLLVHRGFTKPQFEKGTERFLVARRRNVLPRGDLYGIVNSCFELAQESPLLAWASSVHIKQGESPVCWMSAALQVLRKILEEDKSARDEWKRKAEADAFVKACWLVMQTGESAMVLRAAELLAGRPPSMQDAVEALHFIVQRAGGSLVDAFKVQMAAKIECTCGAVYSQKNDVQQGVKVKYTHGEGTTCRVDTSRVEEAITGVEVEHPLVAPCARCGKGGNWSEHRSCLHLPPFLALQFARRYANKEGFKGYAVTLPRKLVVFRRVYKLLATLNYESEHWTSQVAAGDDTWVKHNALEAVQHTVKPAEVVRSITVVSPSRERRSVEVPRTGAKFGKGTRSRLGLCDCGEKTDDKIF